MRCRAGAGAVKERMARVGLRWCREHAREEAATKLAGTTKSTRGAATWRECTFYLFFRSWQVFVYGDMRAARSLPRPERPGGRSFGMRPGLDLPQPSGAAGRVV